MNRDAILWSYPSGALTLSCPWSAWKLCVPDLSVRMGQKCLQFCDPARPQNNDRGSKVRRIDLEHEFAAPATGRQDLAIRGNGDDLGDPAFTGGDHGCHGAVLCAEAYAAADLDGNAEVEIAFRSQ